MRWLVVVKNIETGNLEIITPQTDFDPDAFRATSG